MTEEDPMIYQQPRDLTLEQVSDMTQETTFRFNDFMQTFRNYTDNIQQMIARQGETQMRQDETLRRLEQILTRQDERYHETQRRQDETQRRQDETLRRIEQILTRQDETQRRQDETLRRLEQKVAQISIEFVGKTERLEILQNISNLICSISVEPTFDGDEDTGTGILLATANVNGRDHTFIATCGHVTLKKSLNVKRTVLLPDGSTKDATMLWPDNPQPDQPDLAFLAVEGRYQTFPIKPSINIDALDTVYNVGFPSDDVTKPYVYQGLVVRGDLNQKNHLSVEIRSTFGCSGGPLFDKHLNLIGILIQEGIEGINEFVPCSVIMNSFNDYALRDSLVYDFNLRN